MRQYLGYNRFDDRTWVEDLNQIYTSEWRLLYNFFMPSVKLIEKKRAEGRIEKKYDAPKTPYQRLLESPSISKKVKQDLKHVFASLNPLELSHAVEQKVKDFLSKTLPIECELDMKKVC